MTSIITELKKLYILKMLCFNLKMSEAHYPNNKAPHQSLSKSH